MGSIASVPNGISYVAAALDAANGANKGTNSPDLEKILESATPSDAVELSSAALQLQQVDGLLELPSPNSVLLPGVTSTDLANATPDQLDRIAIQGQALQQQASLFTPAPPWANKLNVLA